MNLANNKLLLFVYFASSQSSLTRSIMLFGTLALVACAGETKHQQGASAATNSQAALTDASSSTAASGQTGPVAASNSTNEDSVFAAHTEATVSAEDRAVPGCSLPDSAAHLLALAQAQAMNSCWGWSPGAWDNGASLPWGGGMISPIGGLIDDRGIGIGIGGAVPAISRAAIDRIGAPIMESAVVTSRSGGLVGGGLVGGSPGTAWGGTLIGRPSFFSPSKCGATNTSTGFKVSQCLWHRHYSVSQTLQIMVVVHGPHGSTFAEPVPAAASTDDAACEKKAADLKARLAAPVSCETIKSDDGKKED